MSSYYVEEQHGMDKQDDTAQRSCSVIIPVYNEELAILDTLDQLIACLDEAELDYEVIVVNDGSTDGSSDLLQQRDDIRLLEHRQNRGYGASLKTGIRYANHELIVITDADGTYPLDQIPAFLELAQSVDMVVGSRDGAINHQARLRQFAKWFLLRFAQWIARYDIPDLNSGFRVLRKSVVEKFLHILPNGFSFTTTITLALLTSDYRVRYETIDYRRRVGSSKIRPIRDTLGFLQLILRTGMYFAPLRIFLPVAGLFGLGFLVSLGFDIANGNLTESTLLLLVAATQTTMFALLADMIDKRSQ